MIDAWLTALEASAPATALRGSTWAYPLVNAGHILGVALLVGSIVPLELRMLGVWSTVPSAPLWRVLTRTAGAGLGLTVACGVLLFICRASTYAASSLFVAKMVLVGSGLLNALIVQACLSKGLRQDLADNHKTTAPMRIAAGFSLLTWLAVLILGRLIGYF